MELKQDYNTLAKFCLTLNSEKVKKLKASTDSFIGYFVKRFFIMYYSLTYLCDYSSLISTSPFRITIRHSVTE